MEFFLWLCKILKNNNLGWIMSRWSHRENVSYMHFVHHYHSFTLLVLGRLLLCSASRRPHHGGR
jgi:heme A synthase